MRNKNNLLIITSLFAFIVFVCHVLFLNYIIYVLGIDKAASVGDSFGSLNSLFSGLAFAILIGTIYLQKNELELQRQELSLTREEIRRSSEAAELSAKYIQEQAEAMRLDNEFRILGRLLEIFSDEERDSYNIEEFTEEDRYFKKQRIEYYSDRKMEIVKLLEERYEKLIKK
ncbi:hypothetical protein EHQ61_03320 [Leptospira wolffii]|uniref:hypothetical protein n=1 Tax=Leptospira wolffii TaxID=409998 RepID=UPI001083A93B|nr:hypothetical protein [Leptospira wolffii]TGL54326.1 hypothetical protein EHQ61_03320 [Leptospira wolffii]